MRTPPPSSGFRLLLYVWTGTSIGMAEGLLNCTRPDDSDDIKIETQGRPMCPDDEILVVGAHGASRRRSSRFP